jgi:hypothetical protein
MFRHESLAASDDVARLVAKTTKHSWKTKSQRGRRRAMIDRQEQLRGWYGLDFPADLFDVWELANELRPKAPRDAFETISLHLDGVFDVLAGRFDGKQPVGPLWTHGMSYQDPPEFFTVFWGECDGYHLGLWFDEPAGAPSCVVSYYNNDAYDLGHYPANLLLTLRRELELSYESTLEYLEEDPSEAASYRDQLRRQDGLREALRPRMPGATRRRTQKGQEYLERYTRSSASARGSSHWP